LKDVFSLSATELAKNIQDLKLSASEVVSAHIARAQAVNPSINAIVVERFEQAIRDAKEIDKLISRSSQYERKKKRFLGVPITIKEILNFKGLPCTIGSQHRKSFRADEDATVVRRMRDQGAIPIGLTNVPEWAFWFECDNLIYGASKNPHNPLHTPGGSSGGEAAIIAAGASPLGLGSDVGGSIRMPASFCGIFGHKPTNRMVPLTGHFPLEGKAATSFTGARYPFITIGPMSRRACDLWPTLVTMMGEDGIDSEVGRQGWLDKAKTSAHAEAYAQLGPEKFWKSKKVFLIPKPKMQWIRATDDELTQVVKKVGLQFESLGAHVQELDADSLINAFEIWSAMMKSVEGEDLSTVFGGGRKPPSFLWEISQNLRGQKSYTLPILLVSLLDRMIPVNDRSRRMVEDARRALRELETVLGDDGILILPPHPRPAPKLGSTLLRPFDFAMTGVFNVFEVPATAAPIELNAMGLPLGVQIIASRGNDRLSIAAAETLEAMGFGWLQPKSLR